MRVNGKVQCLLEENSISQVLFTATARLARAIVLSSAISENRGHSSHLEYSGHVLWVTDSRVSTDGPSSPGVQLHRPRTLSRRVPPPAPGTSRPLTLRAGSGRARRGGAAVQPLPGVPGRLCSVWGLPGAVPRCSQAPPQTLRWKAKLPGRRKGSAGARPPSAPTNHRAAPRSAN